MIHESVRSIASRLSETVVGVDLLAKAVLHEIGDDPDRMRQALIEILPDYCGTQVRSVRQGVRRPSRSAKVEGIRNWYARYTAAQLHVADGYRRLADCTVEDLLFAVNERREIAAATLAKAAELDRLRAAMEAHNAHTVSDLDPEIVRAAVEGT